MKKYTLPITLLTFFTNAIHATVIINPESYCNSGVPSVEESMAQMPDHDAEINQITSLAKGLMPEDVIQHINNCNITIRSNSASPEQIHQAHLFLDAGTAPYFLGAVNQIFGDNDRRFTSGTNQATVREYKYRIASIYNMSPTDPNIQKMVYFSRVFPSVHLLMMDY